MMLNMPLVSSYTIELCPFTARIAAAIGTSRIKLKSMKLFLDEHEQLELLKSSTAAQALQTLKLDKSKAWLYDILKVNSALLIDIGVRLKNLVSLEFNGVNNGPALLFDIMNKMPDIQSLSFDGLLFPASEPEDDTQDRAVSTCHTKHLNIEVFPYEDGEEILDQMNNTFKYFLDYCPLLETFEFSEVDGYDVPVGCLDFNFTNHKHMKSIKVERLAEQYFTFSDEPSRNGKRYKDYYNLIDESKLEDYIIDGKECSINISWQGQVETNVS